MIRRKETEGDGEEERKWKRKIVKDEKNTKEKGKKKPERINEGDRNERERKGRWKRKRGGRRG